MILCQTPFIVILGRMGPADRRLDNPWLKFFISLQFIQRKSCRSAKFGETMPSIGKHFPYFFLTFSFQILNNNKSEAN